MKASEANKTECDLSLPASRQLSHSVLNEVLCRTALSDSGLEGLDYSLNPYKGCAHGCIYCYAPDITHVERAWGTFVDVKMNIPEVLDDETRRKKRGAVGLGTVTDPYQSLEEKYKLTRKCLEILAKRKWPVCIQTKSALVLRDVDLLKGMDCEVGFTITAIDDFVRASFEPGASSLQERLRALKELADAGIRTFAFIGPILPHLTDKNGDLERLVAALAEARVGYVMADMLRIRPGIMECIEPVLRENYPYLLDKWREALAPNGKYFEMTIKRIGELCEKYGLHFLDRHPFKTVKDLGKQQTLF